MLFFSLLSVSVADLQTHSELDPDSDGSFTEAEAQVSFNFHWMRNVTHAKNFGKPNCSFYPFFFAQVLLGGVDKVDTVGFESVWNSIKDKYVSEVRTY